LISLFPDKRFNPIERNEYNRQMQGLFEDVRDFIVLHYNKTKRDDSEFWNYCRSMNVPDSLTAKEELWRAKGRVFRDELELFPTTSWVAVMFGQGVVPEDYEPIADALDEEKVASAFEQIRLAILQTAERLPTHGEFIAQIVGQRPAESELPEFVF
jgi:tryptophan halogenase